MPGTNALAAPLPTTPQPHTPLFLPPLLRLPLRRSLLLPRHPHPILQFIHHLVRQLPPHTAPRPRQELHYRLLCLCWGTPGDSRISIPSLSE